MTTKGQQLYSEAKRLTGGSQLFSKRPELHAPQVWPPFGTKASGIEVTDVDGRVYKDFYLMNVGANILGYRDEDVDQAVVQAISKGQSCSLNFPEEVELARMLTTLHPWASGCRFTRSGGEAVAVAVRIARATTRRNRVLVCGYHGWHDWYLAGGGHLKGLTTVGVPRQLEGTTFPFQYGCPEKELETMIQYLMPAAIVMEPFRYDPPPPGWLEYLRYLTDKTRTMLIFDEVSTGFRYTLGGVHLKLDIEPDMVVFSKAMGNGYPIAAVVGTEEAMTGANSTFISSTTWSERIGFAAAIATIQKLWVEDVYDYIRRVGTTVADALRAQGLSVSGQSPMIHIEFESAEKRTLYTQLMLERGFLAGGSFYPSYAHTADDIASFIATIEEVIPLVHTERLRGPVAQEGFQRLT